MAILGILIAILVISYGVYIRAYSQGFKDGLNMGKRLEKIDSDKAEKGGE